MNIHVTITENTVILLGRAESEDGIVGDIQRKLNPGDSAFGFSYDEWKARGEGLHEVKPKEGGE